MKYLKAVIALSLITFSYGCGGPHVTGEDPASSGSGSSDSSSTVASEPADDNRQDHLDPIAEATPIADVVEPTPAASPLADNSGDGGNGGSGGSGGEGSTGSIGLAGAPGSDGSDGADAVAPIPAPAPEPVVVVPAPAPVVVINGNDGRDGRDGRDGAAADNVPLPTRTYALTERELSSAETSLTLPYVTSFNGRRRLEIMTLGQGRVRGTGRVCDHTVSSCAVKDSMVLFHVDIDLPARDAIIAEIPFTARIRLNYTKRSASPETFDDTELFCILDNQTCTGKYFLSADEERARGVRRVRFDWSQLINPNFGSGNGIVNDIFSQELAAAAARHRVPAARGRRAGAIDFTSPEVVLDLAQVFGHGSVPLTRSELMDLLYGNQDSKVGFTRTLTFLISDDIMLNSAEMLMGYSWTRLNSAAAPTAAQ